MYGSDRIELTSDPSGSTSWTGTWNKQNHGILCVRLNCDSDVV